MGVCVCRGSTTPPTVALPVPEALPALPAPSSEEGMVVDPEAERRKRPSEKIDADNAQSAPHTEGAGAQSYQEEDSQTVEVLLAIAATSARSSQEVHVEDNEATTRSLALMSTKKRAVQ